MSSCFSDLKWPWCHPDDSKGIFDCSDSGNAASVNCCLSTQTTDNKISNCPEGWASQPDQGEWCTDNWNAFGAEEYRHKCHRINTFPDYDNNNLNCGGPGRACDADKTCVQGQCILPCPEGLTTKCNVNGVYECADTTSDPRHCGECGKTCGPLYQCFDSDCVCASTFCTNPDGGEDVCVDLERDGKHCGTCGNECPEGINCLNSECQPCALTPCLPGEDCGLDGKIGSASYNSATREIKVTYSLERKPPSFSAFLKCANTETEQDIDLFGGSYAPEGKCIEKTATCAFVPNVCYLIVEAPSAEQAYLSKICVDPVSSACGPQDTALKEITPGDDRGLLASACIDLTRSVENCGECGTQCPVTEDCTKGTCVEDPGYCRSALYQAPTYFSGNQCVYANVRKGIITALTPNSFTVDLTYDVIVPPGATYVFQGTSTDRVNVSYTVSGAADGKNAFEAATPLTNAQKRLTFENIPTTGLNIYVTIVIFRGASYESYERYDSMLTYIKCGNPAKDVNAGC